MNSGENDQQSMSIGNNNQQNCSTITMHVYMSVRDVPVLTKKEKARSGRERLPICQSVVVCAWLYVSECVRVQACVCECECE